MLDTLKRWLKLGSPQLPGDPMTFPYTHTAPDGNVTVTVHSLSLNRCGKTLPCWGYESKGLMAFGQKELLLLLKREPGESESDFVRDPLGFFVNVARFAQEGRTVTSGGITQFGAGGKTFCGRHYLLYSFLTEALKRIRVLQTPAADMLLVTSCTTTKARRSRRGAGRARCRDSGTRRPATRSWIGTTAAANRYRSARRWHNPC